MTVINPYDRVFFTWARDTSRWYFKWSQVYKFHLILNNFNTSNNEQNSLGKDRIIKLIIIKMYSVINCIKAGSKSFFFLTIFFSELDIMHSTQQVFTIFFMEKSECKSRLIIKWLKTRNKRAASNDGKGTHSY